MSFRGKVAIVTGAGSGIGAASAKHLAKLGATVVVSDINAQSGETVVHAIEQVGGQAAFIQADASKEEDVAALVSRTVGMFNRLDCALNNVGLCIPGSTITDMQVHEWDNTLDLSLRSTWLAMKHEIPVMLA